LAVDGGLAVVGGGQRGGLELLQEPAVPGNQ
jgi:hypothetical protein